MTDNPYVGTDDISRQKHLEPGEWKFVGPKQMFPDIDWWKFGIKWYRERDGAPLGFEVDVDEDTDYGVLKQQLYDKMIEASQGDWK